MAYVTPDYVKQMQLKHKAAFWKISDKTKKTVINRNQTDNLNASIDELQEALNIAGDYVIVTLYTIEPKETKPGDTRGQSFELMVKLNDGYTNTRAINGAPIDLLLKMQEEKHALNLEMEKLKMTRENEPKKHWIAELAQNNPEIVTGVISFGKIAGGKLIDMMSTKTNKGISAPEPINSETAEVLKKFEAIDPEYFAVLKRMANLVSGEPSMYWQFKNGLGFNVPAEKLK
jgi:hypothetical protein